MTLAMRQQIEELAWTVPVMRPNGQWNCQDWLTELLARMQEKGLITPAQLDEALEAARNAWIG
ncbi:hypothetical protein FKP32DRAFT_1677500 [Trametes sanguinea]|nr:hypothetical protein FKP32DRAFT_1677500 [Trametes sanguinea]